MGSGVTGDGIRRLGWDQNMGGPVDIQRAWVYLKCIGKQIECLKQRKGHDLICGFKSEE